MRRLLLVGLVVLLGEFGPLSNPVVAQGGTHAPRTLRYTVTFESHNGESFTVFMDGEAMNRMPQSRVMVSDVSDQRHEVVVVMKRPVQKAAVMYLLPGEPNVLVNVTYDARLESLLLYTPGHNLAMNGDRWVERGERNPENGSRSVEGDDQENRSMEHGDVRRASDEDVNAMVLRMRGQTFDSDRLALGKVIVVSSLLTAAQIARLVETLDYSSSQVELLKYAYHYCADRKNYIKALDVLTFSTDRRKVQEYIATQQQ